MQAGRSGALVVRGDAGIGKTALLEHIREEAATSHFRVGSATGIEAEMQFAFAGLHQLCAPLLDHLDILPEPQQIALGVALGTRSGPTPDRFLVGLATLHLLAEAAEQEPLLCLIDDAQWLDQASAEVLAFVARRIAAERIALVFAIRDTSEADADPFLGLPQLRLAGLGQREARELLATAVVTPLGEEVVDRIVAEAGGNPLALLEYPHSLQPARLAGGFELPDAADIPRRIERSFQQRTSMLPSETQLLLLVASADPTADARLLWRAAGKLGLDGEAAAPAEAAGLLAIDNQVRFRHPLARSAIYRSATTADRRRVHSALARATDAHSDPDRSAWHHAQAVMYTDEEAAAGLVRSAGRARARGGVAAAAAFLEYAAKITPDPFVRASRSLDAAHAKHDAGASEAAQRLLTIAETGPLDELQRARVKLLWARTEFYLTRSSQVPRLLLDAAVELAPVDAPLSRETYLHALDAALVIGSRDPGCRAHDVAAAAVAAPPSPSPSRPADLLLDGLVTTFTKGFESGAPGLRLALEEFRESGFDGEALGQMGSRHWLWLASRSASSIYDDDLLHVFTERNVRLAREASALTTLSRALDSQSVVMVLGGKFARASELAAESVAISLASGAEPLRYGRMFGTAWRGDEAETRRLHAKTMEFARGSGVDLWLAHYVLAVLHNALGNYAAAYEAATHACQPREFVNASLALPELIEAASRAGETESALSALEELESRARASGTQWALGLAASSRALTSTGHAAEESYREAIERLQQTQVTAYLARAHLVYGEWLRREGRRQAARECLRSAHEMLSDMGADAFAARAAVELRATGERPRKRSSPSTDELTAQEMHVARLVATGATNREVGTQLFLSPRTIESHLRNIYPKLGITSRRQLREVSLP